MRLCCHFFLAVVQTLEKYIYHQKKDKFGQCSLKIYGPSGTLKIQKQIKKGFTCNFGMGSKKGVWQNL